MNFVAKNEDYFSKQALLGFDIYQQQGRDEILNNPTIKKAWEDTKQALAEYLEIKDQAIINFIYCFLNGLISSRMFEGDTFSYTEQSELLANMLTTYLQTQKNH
ncbi:MAG: hypothetical protein KatS3mg066_3425 [Fischerella sp.]|nr:MAG: hypothetical protein KatS3mg066_3425 [Fischerella sp.]